MTAPLPARLSAVAVAEIRSALSDIAAADVAHWRQIGLTSWLLAQVPHLLDLVAERDEYLAGAAAPAGYIEEFHCAATPEGEEDHEHDRALPCRWGFRCNICHRDVGADHCPDHAPLNVPGLRLVDCAATPRHRLWVVDADDYGPPPCWVCDDVRRAAEAAAARACRHWPWRRWRITNHAANLAYALGIASGVGGWSWGDGHNDCVTFHVRGRRPYVLGVARSTWRCWLHGHRRGVELGVYGYCGRCLPQPCCGSTGYGHADGCPEGGAQ